MLLLKWLVVSLMQLWVSGNIGVCILKLDPSYFLLVSLHPFTSPLHPASLLGYSSQYFLIVKNFLPF